MRRRVLGIGLLSVLLGSIVALAGCSKAADEATSTAGMAPPKMATNGGKQMGVPDMNDYPAPNGVKTGTEGGKK